MISYELWYHRYDIIELWYHTYDIIGQNYDIICQNYDIIVSTMISGVPRFQMRMDMVCQEGHGHLMTQLLPKSEYPDLRPSLPSFAIGGSFCEAGFNGGCLRRASWRGWVWVDGADSRVPLINTWMARAHCMLHQWKSRVAHCRIWTGNPAAPIGIPQSSWPPSALKAESVTIR